MASVINTNLASLYAQKNLSGAQDALSNSVERLSSGLRINRAKDDAAGLGISEQIKRQITALNQGARNANDAISMVQAAEGSLSEVSDILIRMKELAVQGRDDALSVTQRKAISDELVQLKNEINSIADRTQFNGLSLLKNSLQQEVTTTGTSVFTDSSTLNTSVFVDAITLRNVAVGSYQVTAFASGTIQIVAGSNTGTSISQAVIASANASTTTLVDFDELGISFTLNNQTNAALALSTHTLTLNIANDFMKSLAMFNVRV
jgi:flagellin